MRHQARTVGLGSGDTFEHNGKLLNEALAIGIVTEEQLDADRPGAVSTTRTNAKLGFSPFRSVGGRGD